jgi:hypothetical protein
MTDKMSEIQKIAESIKRGIDEGNEALSNRSILFYELWCAYDRLKAENAELEATVKRKDEQIEALEYHITVTIERERDFQMWYDSHVKNPMWRPGQPKPSETGKAVKK